jgi:hypothetical protein
MALRSLDDVKESVRTAGTGLVRGLRGTCLRLMDASQTSAVGALGLPALCKLRPLAPQPIWGSHSPPLFVLPCVLLDRLPTKMLLGWGCTYHQHISAHQSLLDAPLPCHAVSSDTRACVQVVLPLLVGSQGFGSNVPEVRGIAVDVVTGAVRSAGAAQVMWARSWRSLMALTPASDCTLRSAILPTSFEHALHASCCTHTLAYDAQQLSASVGLLACH